MMCLTPHQKRRGALYHRWCSHDPNANLPDEDVPMVVKGAGCRASGRKEKLRGRGGTKGAEGGRTTSRGRGPDVREVREKFRRWNVEEEADPETAGTQRLKRKEGRSDEGRDKRDKTRVAVVVVVVNTGSLPIRFKYVQEPVGVVPGPRPCRP